MTKPKRYRDVLALLKSLARDARVPDASLRALLAGAEGEAYGQADMTAIAALHGWELVLTPEPERDEAERFDSPGQYQDEIRRLHAVLRVTREQLRTLERSQVMATKRSKEKGEARRVQLDAAEVRSIDEAFAKLTVYRKALERIMADDRAGAGAYLVIAEEALRFQPAQRPTPTGGSMDEPNTIETTEHDATTEGMPEASGDAPSTTESTETQDDTIDA